MFDNEEGAILDGSISLSERRVFNIATIRVSEISVYSKNRLSVPTLCENLCTIHFVKA